MMLSLGMRLSIQQKLQLTQHITFPSPNWSAVNALHYGAPCRADGLRRQLSVDDLTLRERLSAVDNANELFRYDYKSRSDDNSGKSQFFRVPLMRDRNIRIADIQEPISRRDFLFARDAIEKVGALERIVRAVPYGDIHDRISAYLGERGESLDSVVLVGVDRGGRIPTLLTRAALGKSTAYFLKVDQCTGQGPNVARLQALGGQGVFRDRFVLFVDSTVDSGRQIDHLSRWFDEPSFQRQWGHRGWVVAGSNDEGKTVPHHVNINWGVDPDTTFEDDPSLMGVDYAGDIVTVIKATPSRTAATIRAAFLRVPRGDFFDFSDTSQLEVLRLADREVGRRLRQAQKRSEEIYIDAWQDQALLDKQVLPEKTATRLEKMNPHARLAVIGGSSLQLKPEDAQFIAASLSPRFLLLAGTSRGIPGAVQEAFSDIDGAMAITFNQEETTDSWIIPTEYRLGTEDAATIRHIAMVSAADVVFALPGSQGTLNEILIASALGKPIVALRGQITQALRRVKWAHENTHLQIVDTLQEGVARLHDFVFPVR